MDEEKTASKGIYESNVLKQDDQNRICVILERIVKEGRISVESGDNYKLVKR